MTQPDLSRPAGYRPELPPLPPKLQGLPIDHRGYPVPFFVAWIDGKPDHRVQDPQKMARCVREGRCWMCGGMLHAFKAFTIGPMCAINRINSEPPAHTDCARYATMACPFLSRPHAKRREAGMPDGVRDAAGLHLRRNPGAMAVWVTKSYRAFQPDYGSRGVLFDLGEPEDVEWYAEGRLATREEVLESVDGGLPVLQGLAREEGPRSEHMLEQQIARFKALLGRFPPKGVAGAGLVGTVDGDLSHL